MMNVIRNNAVDGNITHFHEALMPISKIFFDLDMKLPTGAVTNSRVLEFCQ
jgi:hypothetical protein